MQDSRATGVLFEAVSISTGALKAVLNEDLKFHQVYAQDPLQPQVLFRAKTQ